MGRKLTDIDDADSAQAPALESGPPAYTYAAHGPAAAHHRGLAMLLKRVTLLWTVLRGDARQLWFALRHPAAPGWLKLGTAMLALYVISPIDIVPDFLPFIGIADDLVLLPFAVRWMLQRLPPDIARASRK